MAFINPEMQKEISAALEGLQQPVELVLYTAPNLVLPGQDEPGMQNETRQLLSEVVALNPLLSLVEKPLHEGANIGLSHAPTLLLREQGSQRHNIRFIGLPSGYEFATLLHTLLMLGTGQSELGEKSQSQVAQINTTVRMQAFVTPTCPYCPQAVLSAYKMAFHNPHIIAEGIEASEFPKLSQQFRISGVPDTIISGKEVKRVLGGQPDRVFVQAALEAAGVSA